MTSYNALINAFAEAPLDGKAPLWWRWEPGTITFLHVFCLPFQTKISSCILYLHLQKKKRYHQTVYLWNFFPFWGADLHISQLKLRDHQLGTKRPTPEGGIHRTPIQAGQMKMALSSMSRMRSVHLRLAESAIRKYFGLADFSNSPGYQVYPSIRISDRVFKHLSHFWFLIKLD